MKRVCLAMFGFACLSLCGGCLMPRDFTARLDVRKDGSYDFVYEGTMTHAIMAGERKDGKMTAEDEAAAVADTLKKFADSPGLESITYAGNDVFNVVYRRSGNVLEDSLEMFSDDWVVFEFSSVNDGEMAHFTFLDKQVGDASEEDRQMLRELLPMRGTIVVATELPVAQAWGNPVKKDGDAEVYTWAVDGLSGDLPKLLFFLTEGEPSP